MNAEKKRHDDFDPIAGRLEAIIEAKRLDNEVTLGKLGELDDSWSRLTGAVNREIKEEFENADAEKEASENALALLKEIKSAPLKKGVVVAFKARDASSKAPLPGLTIRVVDQKGKAKLFESTTDEYGNLIWKITDRRPLPPLQSEIPSLRKTELEDIKLIGDGRALKLRDAGITTVEEFHDVEDQEIRRVLGDLDVTALKGDAKKVLEKAKSPPTDERTPPTKKRPVTIMVFSKSGKLAHQESKAIDMQFGTITRVILSIRATQELAEHLEAGNALTDSVTGNAEIIAARRANMAEAHTAVSATADVVRRYLRALRDELTVTPPAADARLPGAIRAPRIPADSQSEAPEGKDLAKLEKIKGLGTKRASKLRKAGIKDARSFLAASDRQLVGLIGRIKIDKLRKEAAILLAGRSAVDRAALSDRPLSKKTEVYKTKATPRKKPRRNKTPKRKKASKKKTPTHKKASKRKTPTRKKAGKKKTPVRKKPGKKPKTKKRVSKKLARKKAKVNKKTKKKTTRG